MLEKFYGNWWLTQIVACLVVAIVNSLFRYFGLSWKIILFVLPFIIWNLTLFCTSFQKAPTFFQAWFLGNAALAVFGFTISYIFFDGMINLKHYLGMMFTIAGMTLLVT